METWKIIRSSEVIFEDFYSSLDRLIQTEFPQTFKQIQSGKLKADWNHLISPHQVQLSPASMEKMENAVDSLFKMSRQHSKNLHSKNLSVLMSYDFHTSAEGHAKLIEVNTNASGYLVSTLSEALHQNCKVKDLPAIKKLKFAFLNEIKLSGSTSSEDHPISVAIVDDQVTSQKMLVEFYLYQELFESWGWKAEIVEASDLKIQKNSAGVAEVFTPMGLQVNFIYNRTTDFFLKEERHHALYEAWTQGLAVVSPQPQEYELLADKNLLVQMQSAADTLPEDIRNVLLSTYDLKYFDDHEKLWSQRKKFFFKPKNSFGGKSAYRGQSLSHKVFDRIIQEDPLIQEHFPPEKVGEWKFDVRCYVYENHIDHITARLYQGQLTNFSTILGGFCPVRLKS